MDNSAFQSQLRAFIELMLTPAGLVGILSLMALLVSITAIPRLKWPVMAMLLWASTFSFLIRPGETQLALLSFPLTLIQTQGRPIAMALLIALLIPTVLSVRGWRQHVLGLPVLSFFLFELMLGFRIAAGGISGRGVISMLVYVALFAVFGFGLNRWLQDWRDTRNAVRCILFTGMMFLIGTAQQLLTARGVVLRASRLYGTTGNPQHAAMLIAIVLPAACYLLLQRGSSKILRILLAGACGFLIIMLVWTGSRTGLLASAIGVALFFRARLGKILVVAVVVGLFALLAYNIYGESTANFSEMYMRGDTRSHVWRALIEQFREHLAWGGMSEEFGVGESSYLATAGATGLFGLVPLLAFLALTIRDMIRLQRVRKLLGDQMILADLVTAELILIGVGAMFEGYLLGTLTYPVFCIYINLAIMNFILDSAAVGALTPEADQLADSPEYMSPEEHAQWEQSQGMLTYEQPGRG